MCFNPYLIPVTNNNCKVTAGNSRLLSTVQCGFVNHCSVFPNSFPIHARTLPGLHSVNSALTQGFMAALSAKTSFEPAHILNASEPSAIETDGAPVYVPMLATGTEVCSTTDLSDVGCESSSAIASHLIACSQISDIATGPVRVATGSVSLAATELGLSNVQELSLSASTFTADSTIAGSYCIDSHTVDLSQVTPSKVDEHIVLDSPGLEPSPTSQNSAFSFCLHLGEITSTEQGDAFQVYVIPIGIPPLKACALDIIDGSSDSNFDAK